MQHKPSSPRRGAQTQGQPFPDRPSSSASCQTSTPRQQASGLRNDVPQSRARESDSDEVALQPSPGRRSGNDASLRRLSTAQNSAQPAQSSPKATFGASVDTGSSGSVLGRPKQTTKLPPPNERRASLLGKPPESVQLRAMSGPTSGAAVVAAKAPVSSRLPPTMLGKSSPTTPRPSRPVAQVVALTAPTAARRLPAALRKTAPSASQPRSTARTTEEHPATIPTAARPGVASPIQPHDQVQVASARAPNSATAQRQPRPLSPDADPRAQPAARSFATSTRTSTATTGGSDSDSDVEIIAVGSTRLSPSKAPAATLPASSGAVTAGTGLSANAQVSTAVQAGPVEQTASRYHPSDEQRKIDQVFEPTHLVSSTPQDPPATPSLSAKAAPLKDGTSAIGDLFEPVARPQPRAVGAADGFGFAADTSSARSRTPTPRADEDELSAPAAARIAVHPKRSPDEVDDGGNADSDDVSPRRNFSIRRKFVISDSEADSGDDASDEAERPATASEVPQPPDLSPARPRWPVARKSTLGSRPASISAPSSRESTPAAPNRAHGAPFLGRARKSTGGRAPPLRASLPQSLHVSSSNMDTVAPSSALPLAVSNTSHSIMPQVAGPGAPDAPPPSEREALSAPTSPIKAFKAPAQIARKATTGRPLRPPPPSHSASASKVAELRLKRSLTSETMSEGESKARSKRPRRSDGGRLGTSTGLKTEAEDLTKPTTWTAQIEKPPLVLRADLTTTDERHDLVKLERLEARITQVCQNRLTVLLQQGFTLSDNRSSNSSNVSHRRGPARLPGRHTI